MKAPSPPPWGRRHLLSAVGRYKREREREVESERGGREREGERERDGARMESEVR